MIFDTLEHCDCYYGLHPNLDLALKWLKSKDLRQLPIGKYEISDAVYAMVRDVSAYAPDVFQYECHRCFADIQCSVLGAERVRVMPTDALSFDDYQPQKDIAFAKSEQPGQEIVLSPGNMVVLFPQDAHQPDIRDCAGRKIVVKIGL